MNESSDLPKSPYSHLKYPYLNLIFFNSNGIKSISSLEKLFSVIFYDK